MGKQLWIAILMSLVSQYGYLAMAEEVSQTVSTPQGETQVRATTEPDPSQSSGATVSRDAEGATIRGIATSVGIVDTQRVQGSIDGSLRINWNSRDRDRGQRTPPGAPELPANVMFGSGLLFLGFGLLVYRKLW